MYVGKVRWYESFWSVLLCFLLMPLTSYFSLLPAFVFSIMRIRKEIKRMIINKKNNLPLNYKSNYEKPEVPSSFAPSIETSTAIKPVNYEYTKARKLSPDYTVLDFETTGLSPEKDCIIQIAAVRYRGFEKVDEFVTYVNPLIPIPSYITNLNGIKDTDVKKAPPANKALPKLLAFLGDDQLVAHNASFDMKFLLANMQSNQIENQKFRVADTLTLARKNIDTTKNHKLETLKGFLELNHLSSHDALHDCYVAGELYKYCYEQQYLSKSQ